MNTSVLSQPGNSSFTAPKGFRNFSLRKRKRRPLGNGGDDDTISISSLDMSMPEVKRKKSLSRVTSLATVISTPMAKVGHVLQRSLSGARLPSPGLGSTPHKYLNRSMSSALIQPPATSQQQKGTHPDSPLLRRGSSARSSSTSITPYRPPQSTPCKQRQTRYWSEKYPCHDLRKQEIKYQEAVYELCCGEHDLVEDLHLVQKTYAHSLVHLNILTVSEVDFIFGHLKSLRPLHARFYNKLESLRCPETGVSHGIGEVVKNWITSIRQPYITYCANLIEAKAFLDSRRETDKEFSNFLQKCLESPFSRKLDLWSYLDVPRSRLAKYPLLLKQILKYSDCSTESESLTASIEALNGILKDVDAAMAQSRCKFTVNRLEWLEENVTPDISVLQANEEILEGTLRNNRGTKLECHLLDTVFILGRPCSRSSKEKRLQVYRQPIPLAEMIIEDLGCDVNKHGSFKSHFSSSQPGKSNAFRVGFRDKSDGQSHTLIASDEHSKRQWMTAIQKAMDAAASAPSSMTTSTSSLQSTSEEETDAAYATPKDRTIGSRQALFQKNSRHSPRIKGTLSSTALESLKRGGAVKKIRTRQSGGLCQDENFYNGTMHQVVLSGKSRRTKSNSALQQKNQTPLIRSSGGKRSTPKLIKNTNRFRTKSWNNLVTATKESEVILHRYSTRSTTKISKSMSDLLQL